MKRFFSVLLIVCTLVASLSIFSLNVGAANVSGSSGGCSWELDGSVLKIKGTGTVSVGREPSWRDRVTEIIIEEGPLKIDMSAFYDFNSLKKVTLPSTLKIIGHSAFYGCESLLTINLPEGLTTIENYAFDCCYDLIDVTIPKSVTSIGLGVFSECYALNYIGVDKDNLKYTSEDGILFSKDKTALLRYPPAKSNLSQYTVPDSVKTIAYQAFQAAWSLRDINIPDTVEQIGANAFFQTIPYNDESRIVNGVLYIDNHVIVADNQNIITCEVREGTKTIADGAFAACKALKNIVLPEGLAYIGGNSFAWCSRLQTINIPGTVKFIGESAFSSCDSLKNVFYPKTKTHAARISIGNYNDTLKNATWTYNACIQSAEHKWGEETRSLEPTCTATGEMTKVCERCGLEDVEKIAALGHVNEVWSQTKAPTCVEGGTEESECVRCSEITTRRIDPKEHVFVAWYVDIAATCTDVGIEKRTCVLCNELEARNVEPTGHSFGEWSVSVEASCEAAGESLRACATCGATEKQPIEATGHDYGNAVITKKPTTKRVGNEELTCSRCGDISVREIPMLDKAEIDTTLILIVGGVLIAAAVVIIVLLLTRKKK